MGGASGGAPADAAAPLREAWQPVVIAAPTVPAKRGGKPWARVAFAVVIALVIGAGAMHLRSHPLPAGTSAFVAGHGVTYTASDGSFQVDLPRQPEVQQKTFTANGMNSTLNLALVQSDAYEMGVASVVFPVSYDHSKIDEALDDMATEGVKSANGTSIKKVQTTHGAEPALDVRFKAGDGYSGRMLVISTDSAIVMVLVHAKTGTDRLYKALEDSLLIR